MKKKIISLIIAAVMTASTAVSVFAANDAPNEGGYASMSETEKTDFINDNLSVRLQHLSRLATISSNQALDKMEDEIKSALADGLTAVEIKEAIYHSGAYCGFTRAAAALQQADEILKSLGQDITYKSRITSTEETRYDDGLTVQRFLFGPQIGTITDGMEESLKMQTLFLSGICFGDFYNRVGLPLYEREFITLCTIAGNGNCRGQLGGHVNGNLNVGHPKDMLRAAMLYNADINGKEKTDLVLDVIDTTETEVNANPTEERPQPTQAITTDFKSDSEEILSLMLHFKSDDKDNYVDKNIDAETQKVLISATEAVINNSTLPTSNDKAAQVLIDLAVMDAQGGRESELAEKIAAGYASGLTADNMLAVPLLTAPYNGFPRTLNMRNALSAAIDAAKTAVTEKTTVTMQIGNPKMTINGAEQNIDERGTTPVIVDDRTLLPVRAFVEGIGGEVSWDDSTKTATLNYNGDEIRLTINSATAYLNNEANTLDVTPVIINDRTMLPIRFIAESFGYTALWSQDTQTVTIGTAIVQTKAGNVQGYVNNGIYTYHGIPYAEAPERFVPSEDVKPWNGIKTAYEYGAIAPQTGNNLPAMDENCQNLNVWTPDINDGKKRPVMVWLHGGGFSTGSSIESPAYDGENLSKKGDVVVVSVNHRLNSLGHLDLSDYGDKYKYSANAGMTDIIKSLEWIRDNIEGFGGDSDNVTVFGESGGGAKVLALMTSPYAKGLFHKGIVESGATENMGAAFTSREASKRVTEITLENLGIKADEIEKLQTVPYEELTAASDKALTQAAEELNIYEEFVNGYSLLWEPVVDGDFLPTSPITDTGFAEAGKDIPLLIGSNLNEWTVFGNPMGNPDEKLSASELNKRLKEKYGNNADKVKNEFKKAYPNESDTAALYVDNTLIRLPILKLTAHKADQNGALVYSYMFTWGTSYHTAEIPFVFNNIDKVQPSGDRAEAEKLSNIMSSAWINFARTGNPNGSGVPNWEPYTRNGGATMIFDNKSYLANNHDKELLSILAPDYKY